MRVEGRVDLSGNAYRRLRALQDQGSYTQRQLKELGDTLDQIGDQSDQERLKRLSRTMRNLGTHWTETTQEVKRGVREQSTAIRGLQEQMAALSRQRATPTIDLSGLAAAEAKLSEIERRLDAIDRRRAAAEVSGAGGGGGGPGPAGGGGGAGRGGYRSVLRRHPSLLLPALPLINTAVGATTAILGSAAQAGLGVGALAATGYAAGAVGLGGTAIAGKGLATAIKGVTEAQKEQKQAQESLNEAIAEYGRSSNQAAEAQQQATAAQKALNETYEKAPEGTRLLIQRARAFREELSALTRPGQAALAGSASRAVLSGQRGLRRFGAQSINRVSRASGLEGERLATFLTGDVGERFARQGATAYADNLGEVRESLEHILEAWTNIIQATRPYFREGMDWLSRWTKGWATGTADIKATRHEIGEMIDHLRDWKNLAGATFDLMSSLLGAGAPSGRSAVRDLTAQLREWDEWVQRNPEKVREFFKDAIHSAGELAKAIYAIVKMLAQLGEQLRPMLNSFSQLVSLADKVGLLTPGALALAYGAFRGARGAMGGAATAAAAGGAGAAAAGAGQVAKGALSGAARRFAPVALGLGTLSAVNTSGSVDRKLQAAFSTMTLGLIPRPKSEEDLLRQGAGRTSRGNARMWPRSLGGREPRGLRDAQALVRELQDRQWLARAGTQLGPGVKVGGVRVIERGGGLLGIGGGSTKDDVIRARGEVSAFGEQIKQAREAVKGFQERLNARSRERAGVISGEFQERFTRLSARRGPEAALANTLGAVRGQLGSSSMRESGKRELARATIEWAREIARGRPRMQREVRALETSVIDRFKGMAKQTAVINGEIMVGTEGEWKKISAAMSSAARRGVSATSDEFQRLRSVALGALRDEFGFSATEARAILRGRSAGGQAAAAANYAIKQGAGSYQAGVVAGTKAGPPSVPSKARGGRLIGRGLQDTVPMIDGGLAAPGELVVNRHTEDDHDRDARSAGLPTLAERVHRERRKHSDPRLRRARRSAAMARFLTGRERRDHARGGRLGPGNSLPASDMVQIGGEFGGDQLVNPRIAGQVRALLAHWHARVTAGWAPVGTHAANSDHHWGGGLDIVPGPGGSWEEIDRLAAWAEPKQGSPAHGFRWVGYCLTTRARCLTREGWKHHHELAAYDETLGYNPATEALEWTPVESIHIFEDRPVVRMQARGLDVICTEDHRWIVGRRRFRDGRRVREYDRVPLSEITADDNIRLAAHAGDGEGVDLTEQEVAVVAWLLGDGSIRTRSYCGRRYRFDPEHDCPDQVGKAWIYQSKPAQVEALRHLLVGVPHGSGASWGDMPREGQTAVAYRFTIDPRWLADVLERARLYDGYTSLIVRMTALQRAAFFQAWLDAEGTTHKGRISFSQNAGPLLDAMKLCAFLEGWHVTQRASGASFYNPDSTNQTIYLTRPIVGAGAMSYDDAGRETVWCPHTGLGSWVAELDGQLFLTSNTGDPGHGRGNHLHLSWPMAGLISGTGGARGAAGAGAGGTGAGAPGGISLRARRSGLPGVPGALADRASSAYARGLMASINRNLGGGGSARTGVGAGGTSSANQALGRRMMLAHGWSESEWPALRTLWTGESNWDANAINPSSGAGGIPQALPASKMGAGWQGNAGQQIAWGLDYISGRYHTPSAALAAWQSRSPHWYSRGGRMDFAGAFRDGGTFTTRRPTMFVAGEGRDPHETVTVRKAGRGGAQPITVHMNFGGVHVADGKDFQAHADRAADIVAAKLLKLLDEPEGAIA